jgi:proteasome lid subunit RPN8/RPN11
LSTPFQLLLPRQLYSDMLDQARAELPNECCGLFAGTIAQGVATATIHYPLKNALASPTEFLSEPYDLFAAHKDMRRRGIDIVAIYHSHPSSEPVPSARDRERNYSEEVPNLIVGCAGDPPLVRAWWLTATDFREANWRVIE